MPGPPLAASAGIGGMPAASPIFASIYTPCGRMGTQQDCWLQWVVGLAGSSLLPRYFFLSTASLWMRESPSFQQVRPAGSSSLWCYVVGAPSSQHLGFHPGCLSASERPRSGNSSSTELAWQRQAAQLSSAAALTALSSGVPGPPIASHLLLFWAFRAQFCI